jgi:hypothetical protein
MLHPETSQPLRTAAAEIPAAGRSKVCSPPCRARGRAGLGCSNGSIFLVIAVFFNDRPNMTGRLRQISNCLSRPVEYVRLLRSLASKFGNSRKFIKYSFLHRPNRGNKANKICNSLDAFVRSDYGRTRYQAGSPEEASYRQLATTTSRPRRG